jgi:hypothetical protein
MIDRLLAIMALCLFAAFSLVMVWVLKRIDLAIIVGVTILMVVYDFYNETVREPAAATKAKVERFRLRQEAARAAGDPHAQRDQI